LEYDLKLTIQSLIKSKLSKGFDIH